MSLTAIVNLAERLLNNSSDQTGETRSSSKQSKPAARVDSDSKFGDRFSPSATSQQDAGLFQVKQFSIFSAAAEFLLTKTTQPQANPAAVPLAAVASPNAAPTLTAATSASATETPVAKAATVVTPPTTTPTAAIVPAAANATVTPNSTVSQLQALNSALTVLGLDPTELAVVDRVARLIQDFNPLAFTSLVFQLEALAQANAPQSPAPLANAPATGNAAPTATAGNTSGTNTTGGFQIRELVIKFSGVQESISQTGAQGSNSNVQLSAFNLQVQEVNLTLANQAGQSLQVTAPQPASTSQTSAPPITQAKSTAA
jgi:hypothetical protein